LEDILDTRICTGSGWYFCSFPLFSDNLMVLVMCLWSHHAESLHL
jgi:hypothetical protein